MNFKLNALIQWDGEGEQNIIQRILYLLPESNQIITFDVQSQNALPALRETAEIEQELSSGYARLLEIDPYQKLLEETEIPQKHRDRRDKAWKTIEPLVADTGLDIYLPQERESLIQAVSKETRTSRKVIYELLRKYWSSGQIKNAFLPNYGLVGGKTQPNPRHKTTHTRNSVVENAQEKRPTVKVSVTDKENILRAYKTYAHRKGWTLSMVYYAMLKQYYTVGYDQQTNRSLIPVLPSPDTLPSFGQFKYWIKKLACPSETLKGRKELRTYNPSAYPLVSNSADAMGSWISDSQIDSLIDAIQSMNVQVSEKAAARPVMKNLIEAFFERGNSQLKLMLEQTASS